MKIFIIAMLCLSMTSCFLFTKTVNLGEGFTVGTGETVKIQGISFRLKVVYIALSHYENPGRNPTSCSFTINDKPEMKQLDPGSSMTVEGVNIKLQSVNFQPDTCKFIISKVE